MNELTLEHITPYGTNVKAIDELGNIRTVTYYHATYDTEKVGVLRLLDHDKDGVYYHKLLLRPLSELNKPICDLEPEVTFNDWLSSKYDIRYNSNKGYFNYGIEKLDIVHLSYEVVLYLLEHHFDINNLIGKGLAIDINTVK